MQKKATTLIELIISMTIAMVLMTAIGVFVGSGMQNLFLQQTSLDNMSNVADFSNDIRKSLTYANANSGNIEEVASGIVFKRKKEFDNGGFTYIGTSVEDGLFCETGSDDTKTNHIFIKNFIPFYQDEIGGYTLTGKLENGSDTYNSYQKEHKITKNGNIIVGKGVFGDEFSDGASGTGIFLNSPTGMALDDDLNLYFSDTLNNRILYLSTDGTVHKLLDKDDGLEEPTALYYKNGILYIANSGKGEILKLSSKNIGLNGNLDINFKGKLIEDIGKVKIQFYSGNTKLNLTGSLDISDVISFPNDSVKLGYLTGTTEIDYYYYNDEKRIGVPTVLPTCSPVGETITKDFYIENNIIKKQKQNCEKIITSVPSLIPSNPPTEVITYSGSINTYTLDNPIAFNPSADYEIKINNLKFENPNTIGNIYAKVTFYKLSGGLFRERVYSNLLYFKTNGDNKIYTLDDNILEVKESDLEYPNGIWWNSSDIKYNEFVKNTYNYTLDKLNDNILKSPIKNLEISNNNDLLTFILKYYRNYNCFNLEENEGKIKTLLLKKNFK